jgi:hypothetical protein
MPSAILIFPSTNRPHRGAYASPAVLPPPEQPQNKVGIVITK